MARPKKYPDELVARGVRLALESGRPIAHIAADLGMHPETLRKKVRQAEADSGARPDLPTSQEREEIRRLRQESFELRRANEILKSASGVFRQGARRGPNEVSRHIDEHRGRFGVEPICRTLDVSARIAGHDSRRVAVERLAECSTSAARRIGTVRSDRRGRLVATLPGPGRYRLRAADGSAQSLPIVVTAAPTPMRAPPPSPEPAISPYAPARSKP
jgi:transposase